MCPCIPPQFKYKARSITIDYLDVCTKGVSMTRESDVTAYKLSCVNRSWIVSVTWLDESHIRISMMIPTALSCCRRFLVSASIVCSTPPQPFLLLLPNPQPPPAKTFVARRKKHWQASFPCRLTSRDLIGGEKKKKDANNTSGFQTGPPRSY